MHGSTMLFDETVVFVPAGMVGIEVVYLGASSHGTDEIAGKGTLNDGVMKTTFKID